MQIRLGPRVGLVVRRSVLCARPLALAGAFGLLVGCSTHRSRPIAFSGNQGGAWEAVLPGTPTDPDSLSRRDAALGMVRDDPARYRAWDEAYRRDLDDRRVIYVPWTFGRHHEYYSYRGRGGHRHR